MQIIFTLKSQTPESEVSLAGVKCLYSKKDYGGAIKAGEDLLPLSGNPQLLSEVRMTEQCRSSPPACVRPTCCWPSATKALEILSLASAVVTQPLNTTASGENLSCTDQLASRLFILLT